MSWQYPTTDLDRTQYLLRLLGSVWADVYDSHDQLISRVQARAELAQQNLLDLEELAATLSPDKIPVFHQENYRVVYLRQSQTNQNEAALWRFDDEGLVFDSNQTFFFDRPFSTVDYTFEAPADLADVQLITNRLTEPSLVLHRNIDFKFVPERQALVFREDPFADSRFATQPVFQNGEVVDTELALWLVRPQLDKELLYTHFGYVLGFKTSSSDAYKRLIQLVFSALARGSSQGHILDLVGLLAGVELVREAGEVVEDIAEDAAHKLVITDKHVYRFNRTAAVTVAIGDTLRKGQSLVAGFELLDFRRGEISDNVAAIALGNGLCGGRFLGDLTFANNDEDVTITGEEGAERLEFPIGGHPLDVAEFWNTVHLRRLIHGKSLYELLTAGGPAPMTINPAQFLAQNILRNNVLGVRLAVADFTDEALGTGLHGLIRRLLPPHVTLLLFLELPTRADQITIANVTDAADEAFLGAELLSDTVGTDLVTESFSAKHVSFTCH